MRNIVDAIRYLTHNGPVWRALPADFPPAGTVYWWVDKWQADGSAERMHDDLRDRIRAAAGRKAAPTSGAIIDSQSVKGSEMIGRTRRGYDAGEKINGTKRHLAVDALGLLLTVLVTAASVQDRDAARPLLWNLRRAFPSIKLAWADGGYAGKLVTWAAGKLKPKLTLEIVRRPDDLHTFKVLPRRWVVDREYILEFGYLNLKPEQSNIFFKLMEERYRQHSTIITTNLGYDEWPNFLGNRPMVEALLSRLRHYCHTVDIKGPSLREPQG